MSYVWLPFAMLDGKITLYPDPSVVTVSDVVDPSR